MRLSVLSVTIIAVACRGPAPAAGQGTDDDLRVPAGFHVSVFAQNLQGVRFLALGPGNTVYASQPGSGVIVKLPDSNHDGVADNSVIVASGLRGPFGIAFRGDTMYVAEERDVKRFDPGGAGPVPIVPNVPSGGHSTRTILFGPDGKLYLAVGSSCNLCNESPSSQRLQEEPTARYSFPSGPKRMVRVEWPPLGISGTTVAGSLRPGSNRFTSCTSATYIVSPRKARPNGPRNPLTMVTVLSTTPSWFASINLTTSPARGCVAYTVFPGPR